MLDHRYEVVVGNVGTIYRGDVFEDAVILASDYLRASLLNHGRVAGEPVTLTDNGEPVLDYPGTLERE